MSDAVEARWVFDKRDSGGQQTGSHPGFSNGEEFVCLTCEPQTAAELVANLQAQADLAAGLRAKAEAAVKAVGQCSLVTDNGDAIFGAFRQTRCMSHGHVLVPCPVGILRAALNPQPHHERWSSATPDASNANASAPAGDLMNAQPHHEETK